ncbi:membrane dipeptidase [Sphingomonas laterariae]|uniref:Membrane dipeptidase n=1 Tax=Edaphosphingomonas laterariae TaxID=861865 RepID=A0A239FVJ0_9SPHN|nr:membrane dipeptidase [Sphingomonas laterariae]SNS61007.1 membrane dipeptidase [Sphingomonas laterariae]
MEITRRDMLAGAAAFALASRAGAAPPAGIPDKSYRSAFVIDGLGAISDPDFKPGMTRFTPRGLAEMRASGLTAVHMTVANPGNEATLEQAVQEIAGGDQIIADNADILLHARTVADIRAAKASGRIAIVYGLQDSALIGPMLDRVSLFRGLGIRVIQLTYNLRNLAGDGSLEPANGGLSKLGRATIERIEAEKLLLDLSHGGQRTIAEGIAAAKRPLTISHTGCRSLHDNPRNVWDAELKALADKGGVAGIYWMPFLVPGGKASGDDLVRHMAHAVNVCGEDHVAIGTDGMLSATVIDDKARAAQKKFYEDRAAKGIAAPGEGADIFNIVRDFDTHMRFRQLADALARAGWPTTRIEKVLGANLMRLYGEVWGA